MANKKRVIIVGGGFGGLTAAKALGKADLEVVVIDRMNHYLFQPLLYQVATAALSPGNIASPLRDILRKQLNTSVVMQEVVAIDKQARTLSTSENLKFEYDYLVLAPGSRHAYFGRPEWEAHAPGLKTLQDALTIREKILRAFEEAEIGTDSQLVRAYMRFVIVGGGPTGVELAGAIAEISKQSLRNNFRHIDPAQAEIILIEAAKQLLPSFPEDLALVAKKSLEELGVQVLINTRVTNIKKEGVELGDRFLKTFTIIWAAGNQVSPLLKTLDIELDSQGRALVAEDLSIPGFSEVFVIGDASRQFNADQRILPAIAPVAIQQGKYVAKTIVKDGKKARKPFVYWDKGMMATIGRTKAVAVAGKLKTSGFFAWLLWGLVHIYYVIGFKNRTFVLLHWFYLYLIGSRTVRLITHANDQKPT